MFVAATRPHYKSFLEFVLTVSHVIQCPTQRNAYSYTNYTLFEIAEFRAAFSVYVCDFVTDFRTLAHQTVNRYIVYTNL